jgi:UDP-N-acetylmuramyl tripeptide synthase
LSNPFTIALGKLAQRAARLKGGSGSAFPGLVVETIEPDFAVRVLEGLPLGVVVISGTNGKTTTAKIVTELLQANGLRVFTNSTGSNFMRGVIASLLSQITLFGRLDADIAVLELDEAHAVHFVRKIAPRYSLLLNVMRDQLDRFGEIDHTADLLAVIAAHTTEVVVINREDNRLARFASREDLRVGETLDVGVAPSAQGKDDVSGSSASHGAHLVWYGLAPKLLPRFPQDDELYGDVPAGETGNGLTQGDVTQGDGSSVSYSDTEEPSPCVTSPLPPTVTLEALDGDIATFALAGSLHQTALELKGVYNAYNAAAALALVRVILDGAVPDGELISQLAHVRSAFGRGESFVVDGRPLELLLVKNPGGFRLALESFNPQGVDTMIAINDEYADGRDMSWLFDVDFSGLAQGGVATVSGTRAWDMALRLSYDEVAFAAVDTNLEHALDEFIRNSARPLRLYCTYTAMLRCRKHLSSYTAVSRVE